MKSIPPEHADLAEIQRALSLILEPDAVAELRVPNTQKSTVSGYFNDLNKLAHAAAGLSGVGPGVYITLNRVRPDLLARSANHTMSYAKNTTADADIIRRRWFPVDNDPKRPAGISSTDTEHQAALTLTEQVEDLLTSLAFPEDSLLMGDSGNGGHVLVRIDLPNDAENTILLERCLQALDLRFSDDAVHVDLTTYNPARIWKIYGTLAAKGDSTAERPHRLARLLKVPTNVIPAPREALERLAAMVPAQPKAEAKVLGDGRFDLLAWIAKHGLKILRSSPWNGGIKYILGTCPWNAEHSRGEAYIVQFSNGAIAAGCHHNSCSGKGWRELRQLYESEIRNQSSGGSRRGLLEDAVLALAGVCDRAVSRDAQGFNKKDADFFHPLAERIKVGKTISPPLRPRVAKSLTKYFKQLASLGIDINDIFEQEESREQMRRHTTRASDGHGDTGGGPVEVAAGDGPPIIIVTGRFMREITEDVLLVLEAANHPTPSVFTRGNQLARLGHVNNTGLWIEPFSEAALKGRLDRLARFMKQEENKYGELVIKPARPPDDVIKDIMSLPSLPFPEIRTPAEAPVLLPGGRLLTEEGYDSQSGVYLKLNGLERAVSDMPLQEALCLIFGDLLVDFCFADQGSRAHALACLLQPFVVPAIDGHRPLYLFDAPRRGEGKDLLVQAITTIATGHSAAVMTQPSDTDETRKRITSLLLEGHTLVLLDNVTALTSGTLAACLTGRWWQDRLLGHSKTVRVQNDATWLATGNNVMLSDEMARRTVHIRLDSGLEFPELRTGFKHENLLLWVRENRKELVRACLSIIKAWVEAGMPKGQGRLGMFESWVEVMGGILQVAGMPGFLSGREYLYQAADQGSAQWRGFCAVWWDQYGDHPVTAGNLFELAKDKKLLLDIWAGRSNLGAQQRLGNALHRQRDRVYGVWVIRQTGRDSHTGNLAYRLEEVPPKVGRDKTPETPETPDGVATEEGGVLGPNTCEKPADLRRREGVSGVSGVSSPPQGCGESQAAIGVISDTLADADAKCAPVAFTPTDNWQEVPPEAAIPPGLETRMDLPSGKNFARKRPENDRREILLGMPVKKALELWRSEGAPVLHLGPGENCLDLDRLVANPDVADRHLEAVREWLRPRCHTEPEGM